ncbi:MAG: thioesterase family protein [Candidatus Cloacimonadaceae bacterium]|nr:thioesterase family protein [Candidatus Cloacimonadaceae bacterium]MDP3113760.1 thioesterase family protein [Candidatus Cloacimonadaceae bacterium]
MIFEFKKRIFGYDCDVYGHLNNASYLQLLEAARAEALIAMDMSISRMQKLDLQIFILRFELDYLKAIDLEDTVTVKSWFHKTNRLKGFWVQQIFNSAGELCFEANMIGVFASGGKAKRLPMEIYEHFLKFVESE